MAEAYEKGVPYMSQVAPLPFHIKQMLEIEECYLLPVGASANVARRVLPWARMLVRVSKLCEATEEMSFGDAANPFPYAEGVCEQQIVAAETEPFVDLGAVTIAEMTHAIDNLVSDLPELPDGVY